MSNDRRQQLAFRVRARTADHLRRRVRETGLSQTELAERYLEEGLRMDEHPLIVFREGPTGRRPGLLGSRLDVWQIVDTVRQNGSTKEAAAYLGLPKERLEACMRYYAEYPDEIDEWADRAQLIADRERELWERRRELDS